jgi:hypothetical protein
LAEQSGHATRSVGEITSTSELPSSSSRFDDRRFLGDEGTDVRRVEDAPLERDAPRRGGREGPAVGKESARTSSSSEGGKDSERFRFVRGDPFLEVREGLCRRVSTS